MMLNVIQHLIAVENDDRRSPPSSP